MGQSESPATIENGANANVDDKPKNRARTILPQVLATMVTLFLTMDVGASVSFPTILIAALTGRNNNTNPNETLHMTPIQASWLGSTSYLIKLLGSLMCGFMSDTYGRKNAMIFINFPALLAWYFFYYSTSIERVFVANGLLSVTSGFVKATTVTYVGEISESSIRGTLVASGTFSTTLGPLIVFFMGTLMEWRTVALIFCAIQLVALATLLMVPESPIWLMSQNRDKDAFSALKWLRGWRADDTIQQEFADLQRYKAFANACPVCRKAKVPCTHPAMSLRQKCTELIEPKTLKPFYIITICCFIGFSTGTHHLLSFVVQILNTFRSPIDANWATVVVGGVAVCGTAANVLVIKAIGKRRLYLISATGVVVSMCALSVYGYLYLPPNSKSYEHKASIGDASEVSVVPLVLFCICRFFSIGTVLVPLSMLGEVFPLKIRSVATGFTTAAVNVETFFAIKTFYDLEYWTSLPGTFGIYAIMGAFGLIVTYLILPETDSRSLEDIELHFSDNSLSLLDREIARTEQVAKTEANDENQNGAANEAYVPDHQK